MKWVGMLVGAILVLAMIASLFLYIVYIRIGDEVVGIMGGALFSGLVVHDATPRGVVMWYAMPPGERFRTWSAFGIRHTNDGFGRRSAPLWYALAPVAISTVWLWRLDRRRPAPGACRCGYDLTGNTSGRCPECGNALKRRLN